MLELFNNHIPLIASTLLVLFLVSFIILFVILYNKTQLNFRLERQRFHQELLETEIEIREQTLSNVSQELHDNVGQVAALLKMNLRQIQSVPESKEQLHLSNELIQQLIMDIKDISTSLQNHQLAEIGLNEAITKDCERVKKLGFISVQLDCSTSLTDVDVNTSIFLYRMYQEAINNVISHSQASKVIVSLQEANNVLHLTIEDNGIGFNSSSGRIGNGLSNLTKRAKTIDAQLQLNSKKGKGTTVLISLPLGGKNA